MVGHDACVTERGSHLEAPIEYALADGIDGIRPACSNKALS